MPLAAFPPSVRLKEHQTKRTSLIPTEATTVQEISWQDFWRSHAPRGASFGTSIVLKDLFVCNYRPSGAEGSGRLLFARRSRATVEDGFSYQGQLRAADLLVSEAPFFEPLVHRAVHRAAS